MKTSLQESQSGIVSILRLQTIVSWLIAIVLCIFSFGCSSISTRYEEKHEVKSLTVIFLDEDSLSDQWELVAQRQAIRFTSQMNGSGPVVKTVRGFFNFATNTLYCPKWNFEVCGHELHHAVLGQFHPHD